MEIAQADTKHRKKKQHHGASGWLKVANNWAGGGRSQTFETRIILFRQKAAFKVKEISSYSRATVIIAAMLSVITVRHRMQHPVNLIILLETVNKIEVN